MSQSLFSNRNGRAANGCFARRGGDEQRSFLLASFDGIQVLTPLRKKLLFNHKLAFDREVACKVVSRISTSKFFSAVEVGVQYDIISSPDGGDSRQASDRSERVDLVDPNDCVFRGISISTHLVNRNGKVAFVQGTKFEGINSKA